MLGFEELLSEKVLVFDGAMGTMIQSLGLDISKCPESYNLHEEDKIKEIHRMYIDAGADIIQTNTFGANKVKLSKYGLGHSVEEINVKAAAIAGEASNGRCLVAGDIGPTGRFLYPLDDMTFDDMYNVYFEQASALVNGGVDIICIETMMDIGEAKAAVIASRDAAKAAGKGEIPIICEMTFQENGRTLTGTDPETAASILESLGVNVIGINCGLGPDAMVTLIKRMRLFTDCFLIAQPNAGLPRAEGDRTVFDLSPEDFASYADRLVLAGANIIGGCCGTNPKFIKLLKENLTVKRPVDRNVIGFSKLASPYRTVIIGGKNKTPVIGERINPSNRPELQKAIEESDMYFLSDEASLQVEKGSDIIDINLGSLEEKVMKDAIYEIGMAVRNVPLSVDSHSPIVLEEALKAYTGKALLNSVNGTEESLQKILPLARKYGSALVGLTLDENGIPESAEGRLAIAKKIVQRALSIGIRKSDIFIDCLVLTASVNQEILTETLKAVKLVKEKLCVRTVLGISNVSHGLPGRSYLNCTFLSMALYAGLDLPILNPLDENVWHALKSYDVISGKDENLKHYIEQYRKI